VKKKKNQTGLKESNQHFESCSGKNRVVNQKDRKKKKNRKTGNALHQEKCNSAFLNGTRRRIRENGKRLDDLGPIVLNRKKKSKSKNETREWPMQSDEGNTCTEQREKGKKGGWQAKIYPHGTLSNKNRKTEYGGDQSFKGGIHREGGTSVFFPGWSVRFNPIIRK